MKDKILHTLRRWPVFLLMLPLFVMLHELNRNYAPGLTGTALLLVLLYTGAAIAFTLLPGLLLRSFRKAAIITLSLLLFNFFFGTVHDRVRLQLGGGFFFARYTVIIGLLLIFLVVLFLWLRRSERKFEKLYLFLNVLFPLLIAADLVTLLPKMSKKDTDTAQGLSARFTRCDSCSKPDVYVILADEYAGNQELKDIFSFDDSAFYAALQKRGFHLVNNSASNYNATVYSMASLFNMDYIRLSAGDRVTQGDMLRCRNIINNNSTGHFFTSNGYSVFNYSFFNLQGQPKSVTNYYFHPRSRILNFGTFLYRFQRDVLPNHFSRKKWEAVYKNDFTNDETNDSLLRKLITGKRTGPRFVYTHFTRPHHPYYVDRNGHFVSTWYDTARGFEPVRNAYTEHLLYTNGRLLQLVDLILAKSDTPPVILLASDHGFRQLPAGTARKYYFMNLCAIFTPDKDYSKFYDGMSPVNTFRMILNTQFGQRLPLLKDSSIFLTEE